MHAQQQKGGEVDGDSVAYLRKANYNLAKSGDNIRIHLGDVRVVLPQQGMRISARAYLCPRFVAATEGQGYARRLSIHARHSSTPQINGRARHTLRETHTRDSRCMAVRGPDVTLGY